MQHCSLSENKENRNQNIPPQNQKQGQKNNMYAALTSSRDIHLPTHNRYERASLLEGVLNKNSKYISATLTSTAFCRPIQKKTSRKLIS